MFTIEKNASECKRRKQSHGYLLSSNYVSGNLANDIQTNITSRQAIISTPITASNATFYRNIRENTITLFIFMLQHPFIFNICSVIITAATALALSINTSPTSSSKHNSISVHIGDIVTTILTTTTTTATINEPPIAIASRNETFPHDESNVTGVIGNASTATNGTIHIVNPTHIILYNDIYDVSYIAKVNPFWLQFDPPSDTTFYIMGTIYCIISSVGVIGNALVIFMFIRCKSLRTPANKLVINLAFSDLIMLLKCPIAAYNNFKRGPAAGEVACRIYGFLGGLSGTTSIGTLTAIALDRYNVVVHPLDPMRYTSKLRAHSYIVIIWCYSCFFAIIPALDVGLSIYVPEGFLTTCSFDYLNQEWPARIFMFSFFVAAWCIPLLIICSSYFYILRVVFAATHIQSNRDKNRTEQKLAIIVFMIIGLWFLAWTPYSIVAMLGVFGQEQYLTPLGSMIPALCCKMSACIDPYVYAATHPRFRMEFRRLRTGKQLKRSLSTTRSSFVTRSSTIRRRRSDITENDRRNRSIELMDNLGKNVNLSVVPELNEDTEEYISVTVYTKEIQPIKDVTKQSRF